MAMEHLTAKDFAAKAKRYKTAVVATDSSETFKQGEYVAIEFIGKVNRELRFRCSLGERIEVLTQYDLDRFVL